MFNAPKLTNAGKALYYDNMAGTQIVFTTIQLGSGNISGPIAPMTALVTPVVTINAEAKSVSGQYAEISGHFSNAQLTDGFYFREIGVFAADPDYPNDRGKDILYCYQNAYDTADFIPVASVETVEKNITIPVIIGDAAAVSCTLSRSLILASMEDLDNHNKNQNAHEDLRKALEKKQEKITVNGLLKGDGKGGVSAQRFDTKPTKDSGNLLTSGAVAAAMDAAAALTSAAEYSAAMTYAVGAYCTKDGKLYRCTSAIPQAEAWNAAHWTATTMGAELVAIYTTLANKAPATHADRHAKGGADPITPESIGAASDDYLNSNKQNGVAAYGEVERGGWYRIVNGSSYAGGILSLYHSYYSGGPTSLKFLVTMNTGIPEINCIDYPISPFRYETPIENVRLVKGIDEYNLYMDVFYKSVGRNGLFINFVNMGQMPASVQKPVFIAENDVLPDGETLIATMEFQNPPMVVGKEYRTTERYLGRPVYTIAFDFGALPASGYKILYAPAAANISDIVAYGGYTSGGTAFPCLTAEGCSNGVSPHDIRCAAVKNVSGGIAVSIGVSEDRSAETATVWAKYTKTTE